MILCFQTSFIYCNMSKANLYKTKKKRKFRQVPTLKSFALKEPKFMNF